MDTIEATRADWIAEERRNDNDAPVIKGKLSILIDAIYDINRLNDADIISNWDDEPVPEAVRNWIIRLIKIKKEEK